MGILFAALCIECNTEADLSFQVATQGLFGIPRVSLIRVTPGLSQEPNGCGLGSNGEEMMRRIHVIATIISGLVLGVVRDSLALDASKFEALDTRDVVMELHYYVYPWRYTPPLEVSYLIDKSAGSRRTLEESMQVLLSAMKSGDVEWARSCWTKESRDLLEKRDRDKGRSKEFWVQRWGDLFSGKHAVLEHRARTGRYIIVEYALLGEGERLDSESVLHEQVVLMEEGGEWLLTQDLRCDPVLASWKNPSVRQSMVVRGGALNRNRVLDLCNE